MFLEMGRRYLLELLTNKVEQYLFCIVWDVEGKRFSLVFPKERGFVAGWKILSSKLRSLGVS